MKLTDLNRQEQEVEAFVIYKAMQFRWEETADPEREDEAFFLTMEEANEYAQKIKLNVGFSAIVEQRVLCVDDVEDKDLLLDFNSLEDLHDHFEFDLEDEVMIEEMNRGEDIRGSILVQWRYHRYIGYACNFENIGIAGEYPFHEFEYEEDLITEHDSTHVSNYSILLTKKQIEEAMEADNLEELIEEKLSKKNWKWNKSPFSQYGRERVREMIDSL